MNFFNNFLTNIQTNLDPLNFIGILVSVMASIYIFKSETPIQLVKERHEKLIFPLFNILEPVLYQSNIPVEFKTALKLVEDNKVLVDGKLLNIYYLCCKNPSHENFINLCRYIDMAYDKSCKNLKLKLRPIEYRINRKQYKSKLHLFLYVGFILFIGLFFLLLSFLVMLFIMHALYIIYANADSTAQLVYMSLFAAFLFALIKFTNKIF